MLNSLMLVIARKEWTLPDLELTIYICISTINPTYHNWKYRYEHIEVSLVKEREKEKKRKRALPHMEIKKIKLKKINFCFLMHFKLKFTFIEEIIIRGRVPNLSYGKVGAFSTCECTDRGVVRRLVDECSPGALEPAIFVSFSYIRICFLNLKCSSIQCSWYYSHINMKPQSIYLPSIAFFHVSLARYPALN